MKRKIKEKIDNAIDDFIEYDNKHNCFRYFVLGFNIATLIVEIMVLILILTK